MIVLGMKRKIKMIKIDTFLEQNKNVLKKGWIAYDNYWGWQWFSHKPIFCLDGFWEKKRGDWCELGMFAIEPYKIVGSSLRKVAFVRKDLKKVVNPVLKK